MAGRARPFRHERHTPEARSIGDVVFGVNDGLVSITGLIVGVASSHANAAQVLVAGIAAVVAAMVSMGMGAYLATAAQNEYFLSERDREVREVRLTPDEERREVESIYREQGFSRDQIQWLTDHTTSDHDRWINFMMKEELGIVMDTLENPWQSAWLMAAAVVVGSMPPIAPFFFYHNPIHAMPLAIALAFALSFSLGMLKAKATRGNALRSGVQFVVIAGAAVAAGLVIGHFLQGWIQAAPASRPVG